MKNHSIIKTPGGYNVPVQRFESDSKQVLIILPALGVKARFYQTLAQELQQQGQSTLLFEQRGHGQSELRASRDNNWSYSDYLKVDLHSVISWINQRGEDGPITLAGHSMGGHMSLCYAAMNPKQIQQVILLGCGSPWKKAYHGFTRLQLSLLNVLTAMIPVLLGYYPGHRLGFGGREARDFIRDWRNLLNHNQYSSVAMTENIEQLINEYEGNILSLSFDNDHFAPDKSIQQVLKKLNSATVESMRFVSSELGYRADHFSWAKQPKQVAEEMIRWMNK
jgi:predicted alpha/beta hydrolase